MNKLCRRLVGVAVASTVSLIGFSVYLHAQDVMPVEKRQWFDDNGDPLSGGLIYTYTAGTSTSAVTYQDASLSTQHANPVVLDSAGRATIYLAAASYKFVVANSAAVQLYSQDNVRSIALAASQAAIVGTCDFRLTLTAGTPITTSDVTGATTIYATPFSGNRCALYDGSGTWNIRNSSELSLVLGSDAANTNYDLFAFDNAGTMALQRRAWTNNTTRATDLTTQDGVYVRIGATTARYLGTYRTTGTAGQTQDTRVARFVYNEYHPATRVVSRSEATASWTYTLATFRVANANTSNAIGVVNGRSAGPLSLHVQAAAENTGTAANLEVGIGTSSDAIAVGCPGAFQRAAVANMPFQINSACVLSMPVGYSTVMWIEKSTASGTTTWYGTAGGGTQFGGMVGTWSER